VLKSVLGCFYHFGYITKFIKRKNLISEEGIFKTKKENPTLKFTRILKKKKRRRRNKQ
jgi:hypothetical protein